MEKIVHRMKLILPYVVIAIAGLLVFVCPLGNADELWNYNFARSMSLGLLPYKDFNMVLTPLAPCFPAAVMLILGRGLIIYRISGYFLFIFIVSVFFYDCVTACRDKALAGVLTMFAIGLLNLSFIYDYNNLMVGIQLSIYAILFSKRIKRKELWIGLLAGTAILVKQSTGAYFFGVNGLICLWKILHKKDVKKNLLGIIVSCIPPFVFVIYLLVSNTFFDFLENCFYGVMNSFIRTTPIDLLKDSFFFGIIFLLGVLGMLKMALMILRKKTDQIGVEIFLYALAGWGVVYPLCDAVHLIIAIVPMLPVYFYFHPAKALTKVETWVCVCMGIFVGILFTWAKLPDREQWHFHDVPNYECIPMENAIYDLYATVDSYIIEKEKEGWKIRIADNYSAFFTIPLNRYEKYWDLLNLGNLGRQSVEDLLGEHPERYLYLVRRNEEELNPQSHVELIRYVKENFECYDEVLMFDVYKTKDK